MTIFKLVLVGIPTIILLDFVWLGLLFSGYYREKLGAAARLAGGRMTFDLPSAAAVYVLIALGAVLFVLPRVQGDLGAAALWGALYGLVLYGVYDLTNYSVLSVYPLPLALLDLAWGIILNSIVAVVLTYASRWFA